MSVVGVTDFNLKDLIKPEPDRVALILSGLVNFGKFREMQLVNFDQLTEKTVRESQIVGWGWKRGCVLGLDAGLRVEAWDSDWGSRAGGTFPRICYPLVLM